MIVSVAGIQIYRASYVERFRLYVERSIENMEYSFVVLDETLLELLIIVHVEHC